MNQLKKSPFFKLAYATLGLAFLFLGLALTGQVLGSKWGKAQDLTAEGEPPSPVASSLPSPTVQSGMPADSNLQNGNGPGVPAADSVPPVANSLDMPVSEKLPTFDPSLDYRYEPVGKRDPFRPYRDTKVGIGQIRMTSRDLEPLEKFDVKALEVVAIVWANDKPKALIQDPDKQVHSVVKGQRIGKNEGYIAEIREGEVVVVELYDLNGKVVKEPFVMCIDKKKGCGAL